MANISQSTHPVLCYDVELQSDDLIEETEMATLILGVIGLYSLYSQVWTQINIADKSSECIR